MVDTNVLVRGVVRDDISAAIRALMSSANMEANRPAVDAGLAILDAGCDFVDGVIAYDGEWLGGEIFASFDKQAVALLAAQGRAAALKLRTKRAGRRSS